MRVKIRQLIILLLTLVFLPITLFIISYVRAENIALQYLKVLSIHDTESYEKYKDNLYKITGDEIFGSKGYSGVEYPRLQYRVDRIRCREIKGFSSFAFEVTLKQPYKRYIIHCFIYVDKGKIVNAHRKDDSYE